MPLSDENILVLKRAGLTNLQAKIYLSLLKNGMQTVKTIAEAADVDRSNAYREIQSLQRVALVKKIIGNPNFYEALPIQDAISTLISYKKQELEETTKQAEELIYRLNLKNEVDCLDQGEKEFIFIPQKQAFLNSGVQLFSAVQKTHDGISSPKRFSQAMPHLFQFHKAALERGAKMRVIIERPQNKNVFTKPLLTLLAHPNFQMRYSLSPPEVLGGCFDNNSLVVLIDPEADVTDSPCLFTTHHSFVLLFQKYFEALWSSTRPLTASTVESLN